MRLWVAAALALALFAFAMSARLGAYLECREHGLSITTCIIITG